MNDSEDASGETALSSIPRRWMLSTSAIALTAGLAGCTGTPSVGTTPTDANQAASDGGPTGGAAGGVRLDGFTASNVRMGRDRQRVQVQLAGAEPGDEIDIYVELSSLTEASVGTQDLGIVADTSVGSTGWLVTGAEINDADGIVVHVTVEIEAIEAAEEIGAISIEATGLNTQDAEQMDGLAHSGTLSTANGGPDFTHGKTASYAVIDPEEIENVLRVSPSDIRVGETSQPVSILIERATDEIEFRLDLAPLRERGTEIDGADVVVEETAGERRNDEGTVAIDVTQATVVTGIVQLDITTTADTLAVDILITGLNTEDAEASSRLTYPVYTGERPPDPVESGRFRISGAVA